MTVDALASPWVIAVIITATTHTLIAVVDTEGRLLAATVIVRRVADCARVIDALLTITIAISTTCDTRTAIGCTEWCRTTTACVVGGVTGEAGFVDALVCPRVTTVKVSLAADAREHTIIIGADGGIPLAALIRAHDAELTLTADALPCPRLIAMLTV